MSNAKQSGKFSIVVLIVALIVMVAGGALMWHLLQEIDNAPRPATPKRYLKSNDPKGSVPAKFSDPKVDENRLLP